jgi:hypothetical protein
MLFVVPAQISDGWDIDIGVAGAFTGTMVPVEAILLDPHTLEALTVKIPFPVPIPTLTDSVPCPL